MGLYKNELCRSRFSKKLLKENQETVSWITVNGTNINYPVVQHSDNEYYLNHSFDGSENSAGWIFLDYRNNIENTEKNTIIYGHSREKWYNVWKP